MQRKIILGWGFLVLLMFFLAGCFRTIEQNQLTVEFRDYDDSLISSQVVTAFEEAIPPLLNRPGYDFLSWEEISVDDKIQVLMATYTAKSFTITFDEAGGNQLSDLEVTFGQEVNLPKPSKPGSQFVAWTLEHETLPSRFIYEYVDNITLVASYTNNEFQMIFSPNNETVIPNLTVHYQQVIEELPIPVKTGYQFIGWQINGTVIELPYTFLYQHDVELVALYTRNKINVEFQDDDGTILKTQSVYNLGDATCEEPTRYGYEFTGWSRITTDEKIIFKAQYKNRTYNITFASNSAQSIQSSLITFGQTITGLPTPTKENYMFVGWFLDGAKVETPFVFNLDHDIILFAHWEKTNFPAVNYQEIADFGQKLDTLLINANQYHYLNVTNVSFKANNSLYGTSSSSANTMMESRVDKTARYFENRVFINNGEIGYDIYHQVGDNIYLDVLEYNYGKYILSTSLFTTIADFYFEDINVSALFKANGTFRKIESDHYLIYTNFGNLGYDDIAFEELAASIDLPWEVFSEIAVEIEVIYSEQTKQMGISLEIKDFTFDFEDFKYTLSIHLSTMVDKINEPIVPFDYNQPNVFLKIPSTIEEITTLTDASKPIIGYESPNPHYYQVQLEAGLYEVILTEFNSGDIDIFAENLTEIKYHPLWQNHEVANNNVLIIPSSGLYYVKIDHPNLKEYTLSFLKLTYETVANVNEPLIITATNEVICEGKFDFAFYKYEAMAYGVLIIDTFGASPLVYSCGFSRNYTRIRMERDNKYFIPIIPGTNEIVFGSPTALSYSFNSVIINDNPDTTSDLVTMPVLTTELSNETYLVGSRCREDYFRLNVESGGIYTIKWETQDITKEPYVDFYSEDGSPIFASGASISLQPGIYYIRVYQTSGLVIYRIKYECMLDQTKTLDFSIATYTGTNHRTDPSIPKLTGVLPTKNSKIYHKFTISELSLVYISCYRDDMEILNDQMDIISFDYGHDPDYYNLQPGTYYLRIIYQGNEINYAYSFAFCILSNPPSDDYPSNTYGTITINQLQEIHLEYTGDIDYYHLTILETKTYYFRFSMNFILYNANDEVVLKEIGYFWNKDVEIILPIGEYYFIFYHQNGYHEDFGVIAIRDTAYS